MSMYDEDPRENSVCHYCPEENKGTYCNRCPHNPERQADELELEPVADTGGDNV